METGNSFWNRRDFLKAGGTSAAALSVVAAAAVPGRGSAGACCAPKHTTRHALPKLSIITPYSPQKLAFAAQAGYEGVVVTPGEDFNPNLSDSAIDQILATSRNAGIRIVSIEYLDPATQIAMRESAPPRMPNSFAPWSFAIAWAASLSAPSAAEWPGASMEDQAKAYADVFNEKYLPVCEKLDVGMGWENYPTGINFATTPERCRPFLIAFQASGWGWNSIPRISCGNTLTRSVRHGS